MSKKEQVTAEDVARAISARQDDMRLRRSGLPPDFADFAVSGGDPETFERVLDAYIDQRVEAKLAERELEQRDA